MDSVPPARMQLASPEQNRLISQSNRLQPRGARFVHRERRNFLRHAAANGNLPRRIRAAAGLSRVAEDGVSSTCSGRIPARSIAALAATAPISAAVKEASDPPNFPIGVRTAESM
jgi:hypothetical protein